MMPVNCLFYLTVQVTLFLYSGISLLRPMYYGFPNVEEAYEYDHQVHMYVTRSFAIL